jgi:hypothetical protein
MRLVYRRSPKLSQAAAFLKVATAHNTDAATK